MHLETKLFLHTVAHCVERYEKLRYLKKRLRESPEGFAPEDYELLAMRPQLLGDLEAEVFGTVVEARFACACTFSYKLLWALTGVCGF